MLLSSDGETRDGFHYSILKTDKSKAYKQFFKRPQDKSTGSTGIWELCITGVWVPFPIYH